MLASTRTSSDNVPRRAVSGLLRRMRAETGWAAFLETNAEARYVVHAADLVANGGFTDDDAARVFDLLSVVAGRYFEARRRARER